MEVFESSLCVCVYVCGCVGLPCKNIHLKDLMDVKVFIKCFVLTNISEENYRKHVVMFYKEGN